MKTEGTNLLLLTISAFWSSSRWPRTTQMSSRRQESIPLGGRYRQVSLYVYAGVEAGDFIKQYNITRYLNCTTMIRAEHKSVFELIECTPYPAFMGVLGVSIVTIWKEFAHMIKTLHSICSMISHIMVMVSFRVTAVFLSAIPHHLLPNGVCHGIRMWDHPRKVWHCVCSSPSKGPHSNKLLEYMVSFSL